MGNERDIWVFAEQRSGVLHRVGLELLGKAQELAPPARGVVTAVLLGDKVEGFVEVLHAHGADRVLLAQDCRLEPYGLIPWVSILERACRNFRPDIFLFGATAMGIELAPRLAARLGTGLSAHCIDLKIKEDGRLLQLVPGWGGGVVAIIECPDHRPQMATVMPGVMKKVKTQRSRKQVIRLEVPEDLDVSGPKVLGLARENPKNEPLEEAQVVVAGGWGIGSLEGWRLVEALAELVGGAVGATRPAVDEGWAREDQMIGQSGKTVRPRLYIGIGISGMMHHVVGMDESECIVAINQDPKAPIFEYADLAIVGDYREIVPALMAEIARRAKKVSE